jgi:hypothetical protein
MSQFRLSKEGSSGAAKKESLFVHAFAMLHLRGGKLGKLMGKYLAYLHNFKPIGAKFTFSWPLLFCFQCCACGWLD